MQNYASLLLFGFFLVLIVDSVVLSRRIKRKVAERFPDDTPRAAACPGTASAGRR